MLDCVGMEANELRLIVYALQTALVQRATADLAKCCRLAVGIRPDSRVVSFIDAARNRRTPAGGAVIIGPGEERTFDAGVHELDHREIRRVDQVFCVFGLGVLAEPVVERRDRTDLVRVSGGDVPVLVKRDDHPGFHSVDELLTEFGFKDFG
jgi:hypothetical protein